MAWLNNGWFPQTFIFPVYSSLPNILNATGYVINTQYQSIAPITTRGNQNIDYEMISNVLS